MSRRRVSCLQLSCLFPRREITMSFSDIPAVPNNPWPELLSTNVAPTLAQADVIRAGVDVAEQGIPLVDSQLARLRRIIQELTTHRQQLQDFASAHRSVLSVLRQVPEDVWTEILLSAIATQTRDRETQARRYKHLCELSSVCRSWRNIIVCSPAFWTQVYVGTRWEVGPPPSVMERRNSWDTGPRLDNLAQRTALQLARSGQMPLKVHVDIHGTP
ncbi:hypothetical protein HMN09_01330300 [Mycena chlorophos]|uniref:F-box domain-containing protein n=1 Tax=Mycena chlorophos TaxID=658473 RepID=A0A8H6S0J3_MYCCL|nr:hypothetical protein HMN09_01330300 [Mycena chlorophos]